MNNSKHRKLFRVKGFTTRSIIILIAYLLLAALLIYSTVTRSIRTAADGGGLTDWLQIITEGLFVGIWLIIAAFKLMEYANKQDRNQAEFMSDISDEEFELIKSQLTDDRFYYKTFYLTDTALYVPGKGLLLPYDKISNAYVHQHRGKGNHEWHIHITDKRGCDYSFYVKQYYKFVKNKDSVVFEINSRCGNFSKIHEEIQK